MRWFVEVASLSPGGGPGKQLVFDAATWQGALAQARNAGGDAAPLSNFTIEVLPEGYRATNAVARLRYLVKKAPDDAVLSEVGQTNRPPSNPSNRPPAPATTATDTTAKSPAAMAASSLKRTPQKTAVMGGSGAGSPGLSPTPAPVAAAAPPAAPVAAEPVAAPAQPSLADGPSTNIGMPTNISSSGKVFFRRNEDPGARSPLTYREVAVAIPTGAPDGHALQVAQINLMTVKKELDDAKAPPGRLVHLAVFDHEWTTRPQRPPLVALTYKDWRTEGPEVKYPAGPGSSAMKVAPVMTPPPSPAAPQPETPMPIAAPVAAPSAPKLDAAWAKNEISSAVEAATTKPFGTGEPKQDVPAAVEAKVAAASAANVPVAAPVAAAPAPAPAPVAVAPAPAPVAPAHAPVAAAPAPVAAAPAPVAAAPAPAKAGPSAPPGPKGAPSTPAIKRAPTPASNRAGRPEDLMSEIFESMHDLHFMRDAFDGGDFVLELLKEKVPTKIALLHFYDINAKEFVIVKARAPNPAIVGQRNKEGIGLLGETVRSGRGLLMGDAQSDPRWAKERNSQERYSLSGIEKPRTILLVPIRQGQRYLGAIELADHADGQPFSDDELHAVTYIAEQFAEFIADRGIMLAPADPDASQAAPAAGPASKGSTGKRK